MRSLFMFIVCVCALGAASIGCGEDTAGGAGAAGSGGTAGSGGSAGTNGTAGTGGAAPVIEKVEWAWAKPCDANASGQGLVVTITAKDADTPVGQLTYSGQVQDCTGDINAMETTLSCEVYLGARQSEATVTDPQGNNDSLFFPPDPCTDGACPGSPGCP